MTLEAAFYDLLTTSVQRNAFTKYSTDGYEGTRSYAAGASTFSARVVQKRERVLDKQGQETVTSHVAWTASTAAWSVEDKFTHQASTYRIVMLDRLTDETAAVHHTKLYLRA